MTTPIRDHEVIASFRLVKFKIDMGEMFVNNLIELNFDSQVSISI